MNRSKPLKRNSAVRVLENSNLIVVEVEFFEPMPELRCTQDLFIAARKGISETDKEAIDFCKKAKSYHLIESDGWMNGWR